MMCQCRFEDFNKCTTLGQDIDSGEGCACMRVKYIQKISGAFAQFYYEPKTALKNKVLKKKKCFSPLCLKGNFMRNIYGPKVVAFVYSTVSAKNQLLVWQSFSGFFFSSVFYSFSMFMSRYPSLPSYLVWDYFVWDPLDFLYQRIRSFTLSRNNE